MGIMKKSITSILMDEHSIILNVLHSIDKLNHLWEIDETRFEAEMGKLISFCQNFADKLHHFKEEVLLFPKMIENNPMLESGVVGEMKEQHEMFRYIIQTTIHLLNQKKYSESFSSFKKYASQLEDHIYIENNELFPMSEDLLSQHDLEVLYFKAIDYDNEVNELNNN